MAGGYNGGMDQALYLPLFYGDARAVIHPGAATEIPTSTMVASAPTPPPGRSTYAHTWCGRMGNPTMRVT